MEAGSGREPLTLHDVLVAWREGALTTGEALALVRIDDEDGLVLAAELSGVLPQRPLTDQEREHRARVDDVPKAVLDRYGLRRGPKP